MSSQFRSDHVREYFSEIERQLTAYPPDCRQGFLRRQRAVFERHEARLLTWAQADDGTPNPFTPPLTAHDCGMIVLELSRLIQSMAKQEAA